MHSRTLLTKSVTCLVLAVVGAIAAFLSPGNIHFVGSLLNRTKDVVSQIALLAYALVMFGYAGRYLETALMVRRYERETGVAPSVMEEPR